MDIRAGATAVHYVEHGEGRPVLLLHGSGVDHREPEACFEPILSDAGGLRRIYPDLPGMGLTAATEDIRGAEDVLAVLSTFAQRVTDDEPFLLIGHSVGGYFAQAMAEREPHRVAGLALVCPLLAGTREVPDHHPVVETEGLGDAAFRDYFVIHTPEMLSRYKRYVVPGTLLTDAEALERIGERWELESRPAYRGPTIVVAGRLDSSVGYAAAVDQLERCASATVAVLDGTGHALPHEQPELMRALILDWLTRVGRR